MAVGEFDLIDRYFKRQLSSDSVALGIGDDCALLKVPENKLLAVSLDTLVADVHFPAGASADDIAQRALRVNLSDLAAVGARPLWFTLGLTLPQMDHEWLNDFSRGLFSAAQEFGIQLVGGDTTRGPLSITIQVHGAVESRAALRRDAARTGDSIYVTGTLGDAAAGLALLQGNITADAETSGYLLRRYHRPRPHLKEGQLLAGVATAALDISDGLLADLGHICAASNVGAHIDLERLPLSQAMKQLLIEGCVDNSRVWQWALSGGDDYRLCFTVPQAQRTQLQAIAKEHQLNLHRIGEITAGDSVTCFRQGQEVTPQEKGYNHFGH